MFRTLKSPAASNTVLAAPGTASAGIVIVPAIVPFAGTLHSASVVHTPFCSQITGTCSASFGVGSVTPVSSQTTQPIDCTSSSSQPPPCALQFTPFADGREAQRRESRRIVVRRPPSTQLPAHTTKAGSFDPAFVNVLGVTGFEPAASSSRTKRATKLRHTP